MRSNAGFVRLLVEWLETEGPQDVPERVVAAALADARRVGQSHPLIRMPAWPAVARRPRLAFVLLAAALAVALALGALLSVGNRRGPLGTPGLVVYAVDGRLVSSHADGSGAQPVHGARGYSEQPRWSPDGRRLAFWTSDGGEALDLVVLDGLDGTPRIVQRSTRYPNGPSWSPDSKRLVTNALDPSVAGAGFVYSPRILSIIDVETGAAQRLPTNGLNPVFAAWSPAADLIAFWGEGFDPETGIYVMAADGTGLRLLANEPCEYGFDCFTWIDWSPAGDAVVYSTGGANKDVWTVSVDGGRPRRVSSGSINATNPAFSPDGSLIAWFQSTEPFGYGPPGVGSIVVAAADGSKRRALTGEARIPLTTPRWAPDAGSVIVPVLGRDSDTPDELGIFPVEGGAPQLVSLQGSVYSEPSWQRQP